MTSSEDLTTYLMVGTSSDDGIGWLGGGTSTRAAGREVGMLMRLGEEVARLDPIYINELKLKLEQDFGSLHEKIARFKWISSMDQELYLRACLFELLLLSFSEKLCFWLV